MDDELRDVLEGGLEGFAGDLGETIDRLVESVNAEAVADEENSKEAVTVEEGSLPRAKTKAMSEEARHQLEAAKTTFDERLRASDVEVWRIEDLVSVARRERVRGASATKSFFPPAAWFPDDSYELLVKHHLTHDAFRLFREHVERWPGCHARRVALDDEMRKTWHMEHARSGTSFTYVTMTLEATRMRAEMDAIAVAQRAAEDDDAGMNSPFGALGAADQPA